MIRLLIVLLPTFTFFCGCIGPFRKQPEPVPEPIVIESPTISIEWDKIEKIDSDKEKVKTLLGMPDFVDKQKAGEDWYYSHIRRTG